MTQHVTITINGQPYKADIEPRLLLVHFIREVAGLTGTHIGCDTTSCGACTVLINNVNPPSPARYWRYRPTAPKFAPSRDWSKTANCIRFKQGFVEEHGLQCGFCTPGMMMTAVALLQNNPDPTEEEIRWAISGNLCRCTGLREYRQIDSVCRQADARGSNRLLRPTPDSSGGKLEW